MVEEEKLKKHNQPTKKPRRGLTRGNIKNHDYAKYCLEVKNDVVKWGKCTYCAKLGSK